MITASMRKLRAQFDWPLAVGMLLVIGLGLVNLYSATRVAPKGLWVHQLGWYAISIVVFVLVASIDYRVYERIAPWIYAGCVGLLASVFVLARNVKGAHRWIPIGGFELQPSELAKLGTILMLAKLAAKDPQELRARGLPYFLLLLGVLLLPVGLIFLQPDLGTAMLLYCIGFSILLFAPAAWKTKLQVFLLAPAMALLRLSFGLKAYQKQRLLTFLDPSRDPSGAGYHALQSVYAIGSGRFWG